MTLEVEALFPRETCPDWSALSCTHHEPLKEAGLSTGEDPSTTSQNPQQGSPLSLSFT